MAVLVFNFVLACLATWRITHLLSNEDGPFDLVFRFRKWLGSSVWGRLLDCFYCLSIWIALPFGFWLGNDWKESVLLWLAISGAACLLQKSTTKYTDSPPPDYMEE